MNKYNITENGIKFLKGLEGDRLKAYQDKCGIWTIGYGMVYYQNGSKVKKGDVITQAQADEGLIEKLKVQITQMCAHITTSKLNNNMFDALCAFTWNVGINGFISSTLLKKINANPTDPDIEHQMLRWDHAIENGLLVEDVAIKVRHQKEVNLYFESL